MAVVGSTQGRGGQGVWGAPWLGDMGWCGEALGVSLLDTLKEASSQQNGLFV